MKKTTVLFDLDGTLLDTAPDLAYAVNQLRRDRDMPELALEVLRPHAGYGSKALLKAGFDLDDTHPTYPAMVSAFLNSYEACSMQSTVYFPRIENLLHRLDQENIRWGIVTNKPQRFTRQITEQLGLDKRAVCIVSGDTLPTRKPHPAPILLACEQCGCLPSEAIYVGDTEIDVLASKAAGMRSLVVLYGYTSSEENPHAWGADGYLSDPMELMNWL